MSMPGSMDTDAPARDEVKRLAARGYTPQMIAGRLHMTTARVYELLARIRELDESEETA